MWLNRELILTPFYKLAKFLSHLWAWSRALTSKKRVTTVNKKTDDHHFTTTAKSLRAIPGPTPSLPFVGTMWVYWFGSYDLNKLHKANFDKYRKYGKIMKEEFRWGCPLVQVFDPSDIEQVMKHQGRCPIRPTNDAVVQFRKANPDRYLSLGLVNAQGDEWLNLRTKLNPIFLRQKTLNQYLPALNDVVDDFCQLVRHLRDDRNEIHDTVSKLYRLALESVVVLCLDTRLGCLNLDMPLDSEAQLMIDTTYQMFEAYQQLYYNLPLWKYFETPTYKKMANAETTAYNIASKYIDRAMEQVRELQESSCLDPEDAGLTILMSLLSRGDVDSKDIRMMMVDAIVAGIDTVSNSLIFLLYQLACNAEVQVKLYEEIEGVLPGRAAVTANAIQHLPYMKACVREAFRISPTIPNTVRILPEDVVIQNYLIPAGTPICCHTMVTSRLPEYFPDPDTYKPERWLGKDDSAWTNQFSVMPFGNGARMCVGRRFAEQEIYTAIIKLIQNFEITCDAKEPLDCNYRFMVVPDRPISLTFNER